MINPLPRLWCWLRGHKRPVKVTINTTPLLVYRWKCICPRCGKPLQGEGNE